MTKELLENIWHELLKRKRIKTNGCWELVLAANSQGYSIIWIGTSREDGKLYRAHRISAAYNHGLDYDDKDQIACHKLECNNKRCWNPDHIYVGTQSNNSHDSILLGRRIKNREKTHCPQGHEYDKENTYIYNGWRHCKICTAKRVKEGREKNK